MQYSQTTANLARRPRRTAKSGYSRSLSEASSTLPRVKSFRPLPSHKAKSCDAMLSCGTHSSPPGWRHRTGQPPRHLRSSKHTLPNVAGHWKGQCYAWDVVNEALLDDGTWRPSPFYNALGPDYIKLAFQVASETDPDAKLYYNDYNLERPGPKATAAAGIARTLKDAGIRIDGIGMQAHLTAGRSPSLEEQVAVMEQYAETGVEVALTELDVRINLPANETNLQQQKQGYHDAVAACVQVDACVGVTIWDFYDPFSWVPVTFPGQGEPLLWFEDFTKHPAYYGVLEAFAQETNSTCGRQRRRAVRYF
ncbi:hypothetical protein FJTKL_12510 [Diaporthe vaccinii]|uniref:Beta-xylanase n=1 Tax=Diaporthe vaccinii TaxID=105482 RepID=A0ABR4EDP0_9PEZI